MRVLILASLLALTTSACMWTKVSPRKSTVTTNWNETETTDGTDTEESEAAVAGTSREVTDIGSEKKVVMTNGTETTTYTDEGGVEAQGLTLPHQTANLMAEQTTQRAVDGAVKNGQAYNVFRSPWGTSVNVGSNVGSYQTRPSANVGVNAAAERARQRRAGRGSLPRVDRTKPAPSKKVRCPKSGGTTPAEKRACKEKRKRLRAEAKLAAKKGGK